MSNSRIEKWAKFTESFEMNKEQSPRISTEILKLIICQIAQRQNIKLNYTQNFLYI